MSKRSGWDERRRVERATFQRGDDAGVAMVVAIAVIMIATVTVGTLMVYALRENGSSGRERQRAVSIASAEGRVDTLVAQIDGASLTTAATSLCGPQPTMTPTVSRDSMTITSTITYYDATGTELTDCSLVPSATSAAVKATSTSTPLNGQAPAVRTFETVMRVNPTQGSSVTKAIYGQQGVALSSPASELTTATGVYDGDLFSKYGDVECRGTVMGSIGAANGSVYFRDGCDRIAGDVHASGQVVSESNPIQVNGSIKSSGSNITLWRLGSHPTTQQFDGSAYAAGSVTGDICPHAKCNGGQVVDPPQDPDWAGWTVRNIAHCEVEKNDSRPDSLGYWFKNVAPTTTQQTLIRMPDGCTALFTGYNGTVINLNADVAIFARGLVPTKTAFRFDSRPNFVGTAGSIKSLYFIQDYQTPDCTKVGISVENHVSANTNIKALVYTPHTIEMSTGNLDLRGQIYAGCYVRSTKPIDLVYDPMDFNGVVNPGALAFHTEILSKRETTG